MPRLFNKKVVSLLISLIIGSIVWILPPPEGLSVQAMHMLSIFTFTIVSIILRPLPIGTIAFLGLMLTTSTQTFDFKQTFSGFSDTTVWLIVIAFFISRGFIKTGLGERIAYFVIKILGKSTLGMTYGIVLTDLTLAPAIPSITARVGGIIYPIVCALCKTFGSEPYSHPKRLGSFLMKASFQGSVIISGMFLTSMAGNPLISNTLESIGINISWGSWVLAACVPGLICLIVVPTFLYKIYPPEIKSTPNAKKLAQAELKKMGRIRLQEWTMIFTFILLITLWVFGRKINMSAVVAALIGLSFLLLSSVLTWEDIIKEKGAWNTLIWFGTLIMMANSVNRLGLTTWFSKYVQVHIHGLDWVTAFVFLVLVYFYSHYFFASVVAHIGSMYLPFLLLCIAVGAPPIVAALSLAFFSSLCGGLTHYGCGPAPIFFGSGYVKIIDWWKFGFFISLINITVYLTFGSFWWHFLGHI